MTVAFWKGILGAENSKERLNFFCIFLEMATHSSILAWKIPQTGAWQATIHGVARVGHD